MDEWLSDRERGGFYASQDADDSLEDDGDYFTWTRDEAQEVLTAEEFRFAEAYFNLRPVGDMHHNPAKNVLHMPRALEEVAKALGIDEVKAREMLCCGEAEDVCGAADSGERRMWIRRCTRVERDVHLGVHGGGPRAGFAGAGGVCVEVAGPRAGCGVERCGTGACGGVWRGRGAGACGAGVLEDYAFVANAALDAWEATGEMRYFDAAQQIADAMLMRFYDATGGGFFDTEMQCKEERIGALATRRKPLQDSPTPAGNAVAATVLLRLAALTGERTMRSARRRRWRRLREWSSTLGFMRRATVWRCAGWWSRRCRFA